MHLQSARISWQIICSIPRLYRLIKSCCGQCQSLHLSKDIWDMYIDSLYTICICPCTTLANVPRGELLTFGNICKSSSLAPSPLPATCSRSRLCHTHTHTHIVRVCVHYYQILSARLWPWLVWANQLMRRWRNSNKSRRRGVTNHAYDPNWT